MEIQINDDWRVVSDPYGWIVQNKQVSGPGSKTPGEVYWLARTYYQSLPAACAGFVEMTVRMTDGRGIVAYQAAVEKVIHELCAALDTADATRDAIKKVLRGE